MKRVISILFIFQFVLAGCAAPYGSRMPGGIYGNQYGYNTGYGYSNFSQQRTVSVEEVGRNSKMFVVEAEKFHQNLTGMFMCANGGTKTDSVATANGTVTDNSGRINYQIATISNTTEVCNNLQVPLKEVGRK